MAARKHKPIHPGEVLKRDFMEPMGLTAYRVAKDAGTSPQNLGRIIKGQRGIGGDVALRLARYFGTSARFWMNLQAQYELAAAEDRVGGEIRRTVQPYDAA